MTDGDGSPATIAEASSEPRRPALSPSRAGDFKACPLLYRFRAIDRLPERPGRAQVRGTLVHAVLERLFDLPAAQRSPEAAAALVAPLWQELTETVPELLDGLFTGADDPELAEWLASAAPLLDTYFRLEDPREIEPVARELLLETELESGVVLRGYVDRLDEDPAGLRVIDYKTGPAPGPMHELRALFQLKFYALALLQDRGAVPAELRLYYLADGETLSYRPEEAELRRFGRILDALWSAMLEAGRTGDFRPNPGRMCDYCDHRALCPAWGGTPPPYPGWPGTEPPALAS
ncbi:putative RecB family exonuclease [Pseudonocardia thermophila]|jgi:RecB family exonuclease|uniref:Putative RecB family exonuclease n=1 Tax=Pseudonocardia thermophila TaxID=1848 RepID=A0A1M6NDQ9_PSETH|nr:PD-(D/E)XK nuclease family protein [Pseudonocardia thermophila]SHJ93783.1 putative RecB family exonuclease [Pseudonocardia thermophila]